MPVLAVSGLDHDIKVFTPSADQPTDLVGIHEVCMCMGGREEVCHHSLTSQTQPKVGKGLEFC